MINYGSPYDIPDDLPIWQWAEENINLSTRFPGARSGMYRTSFTPYVRPILNCIQDPAINRVSIMKGSQTGLTLMSYIAVCYWICEDPDPILIVMPNLAMARSKSESELQILIRDSKTPAAELPTRPHDFKKTQYNLKRCTVFLIGANSPANLSSRPIRYLILDEEDKFPPVMSREADAVSLAIERTKTFGAFKKIIDISTPTTEAGPIYNSWNIGDCREYFIPCPACDKFFLLNFKEHFKWDDEELEINEDADDEDKVSVRARGARIHCPACDYKINDGEKNAACNKGEYRPTKIAKDSAHVSFRLPAFISRWVTINETVTAFLTAKYQADAGFLGPLQNFINSTCAEVWTVPAKKSVAKSKIWEIKNSNIYPRGTVPTEDPVLIIGTCDVQLAHLVFCIWGLDPTNHWLIDHGYLATLDDLPILAKQVYFDAKGRELRLGKMMLDTGYDTMKCYETCLKHPWIFPFKGESGRATRQTRPIVPSNIESFPGGKLFGGRRSLRLFHVHPSFFKDEVSNAIAGESAVNLWFHEAIDSDFVDQMTSEVLKETKPDKFGQVDLYWETIRKPNDYWDNAQYSFAARHLAQNKILGMLRDKENEGTNKTGTPTNGQVDPGLGHQITVDEGIVTL